MKNAVKAYQEAYQTWEANKESEDAKNGLDKATKELCDAAVKADVATLPN